MHRKHSLRENANHRVHSIVVANNNCALLVVLLILSFSILFMLSNESQGIGSDKLIQCNQCVIEYLQSILDMKDRGYSYNSYYKL